MGKHKLTVSIDEELWHSVHKKKAATGMSISFVVERALREWLQWEGFKERIKVPGTEQHQ
jgi:hypothetical protein